MTDPHSSRPPNPPHVPPIPVAPVNPEAAVSPPSPPSPPPAPPPVHTERRRRSMGWRSKDVLRTAALVLAMYVVARLLWFANPLVLTVFLGVLFGLAVSAGTDRLERIGLPRGVGAGLIVVSFFALLVLFGVMVAPTLRTQGAELRQRLPQALDRVEQWANDRQGGLLGMFLGGARTEARVDSATAARQLGGATTSAVADTAVPTPPGAVGSTAGDTTSRPATLRQRITQQLSGATKYLFPFLSSTLAAMAGLLLIVFLSIYVAADPDLYHRGMMHLFPHRARKRAGEVLSAMATVLRRWLVTQLIAMAVIGTVTTIVLLVLRVKPALALGVIAGLFEFIPTVGPILSAVPAVAMGFLDSPEKALYVVIAYTGIQFAENHLLIPLLMKGGLDLPPAVTIVSQALMALLFGFLGLMVAVPLVAAVLVPIRLLYVEGVVGDGLNDADALSTAEYQRPNG